MNYRKRFPELVFVLIMTGLMFGTIAAGQQRAPERLQPTAASGTAFTYQGSLKQSGVAASGSYDMRLIMYDALIGGAQVGPIITKSPVSVVNGIFTVELDFGTIFNATQYYLEIAVRPTGSGTYTLLDPRQKITAVPYALGLVLPANLSSNSSGSLFAIENTGSGQAGEFDSRSAFVTAYFSNSGIGGTLRADTASNGQGSAITAYNYGVDRYGLETEIINSTNPRAAIYARTAGNGQAIDAEVNSNTNADALFARTTSTSASSFAGIFVGNVSVSGTLSKSAGSFKIDHPLDPANKYLQHSFVESPDMKNIYDGLATLDENGEAIVVLPNWFSYLNRDVRYLLTPIGAPAPNLHIAEKIKGNRFKIAGGQPGTEVSWQVTGIRQDAYANDNRIQIEVEKPEDERGTFLYPKGFAQPAEKALDRKSHPLIKATAPEPGKTTKP